MQLSTSTLVTIVTSLGVIAGATLTIDTRYAKSAEVEAKLEQKADVELVKQIQHSMLEDKISELRIKKFILEQIQEPNELQLWEIQQTEGRLNRLEKKLERDDG